jgi:DNA-binding Lrp family transcriptional regulator
MRAYVLISAEAGKAIDVSNQLRKTAGVLSADAITGEYDVIAHVEAGDIHGVGEMIVEQIQSIDGVFRTITCLAVQ